MIKRVAVPISSLLAVAFLISACASPTEEVTEQPSSQGVVPVPGEKIPGEDTLPPPTGGPSAGVRW
jgi:hypothetical protein